MATIGVIGGGGWLAGALLTPALEDGVIRPRQLILSSRSGEIAGFEDWPGIVTTNDNEALVARADIVVLCVRPQDLESFFVQPLLSTTAILFLIIGLQLLVLGLVADAVLRRFAQYQVPVPSRAVTVAAPAPVGGQVARFK